MPVTDDGCTPYGDPSTRASMMGPAPFPICGNSGGGSGTYTPPVIPRDSRCQSADLCIYAKMPLYFQQDAELEALIRQRLGVYDAGLCVPTATAMMLAGILSEASPASRRDGWLSAFENSWDMKERIYQTGVRENTDFKDGGTKPRRAKLLLQSLRDNSSGAIKNKFVENGIGEIDHANPSTSDLIGLIRSDKHALLVGMNYHRRNKNFWGTSWKRESGHALAVNGFDRDALKIYDPWAEVYYIRLHQEHIKINGIGFGKDRSVVDIAGGFSNDWGFVASGQNQGFKVILDEYIGWAFH